MSEGSGELQSYHKRYRVSRHPYPCNTSKSQEEPSPSAELMSNRTAQEGQMRENSAAQEAQVKKDEAEAPAK